MCLMISVQRYLYLILFLLIFSCGSESDDPGPIGGNFLDNVRYLKLELIDFPADPVLIANGVNSVKFTMSQYDKDKKFLFRNIPTNTVLRVNGQPVLRAPFIFQTTEAGNYSFDVDGIPAERFLESSVELKAIAEKTYPIVTMPVVFHYIAASSASVNSAYLKGLIDFHLEQMNRAYSNGDGTTDPSAVNAGLKFVPVEKDPEGNLLEIPGLDVIRSEKFKFKNSEDKDLHDLIWNGNFWPPRKMINVWVSDFEERYSWARFPFLGISNSDFPTSAFGIFFNLSMFTETRIRSVMVHETGHLLNLYHNFQSQCAADIDQCSDTYDYERDFDKTWTGGLTRSSCPGFEFSSTNYMDYYPSRFNTFTYQQRERMRRTIDLCPFLPTPKNQVQVRTSGRSNRRMTYAVDSSTLIW